MSSSYNHWGENNVGNPILLRNFPNEKLKYSIRNNKSSFRNTRNINQLSYVEFFNLKFTAATTNYANTQLRSFNAPTTVYLPYLWKFQTTKGNREGDKVQSERNVPYPFFI